MAAAVEQAIGTGEHLAVQAGTGTGKSLAYLVPAVAHAVSQRASVVVATATIALQRQLIDRDLPRLAEALEPLLGRAPTFAILKGRRNYLCLHRLRTGPPDEPGETLFDPAGISAVGQQVQRLTEWAASTTTGDRDDLVPGVEERAWRQVSVSARECLGAQRCPFGSSCFAERARDAAGRVDIVVTNHALLAIDALEEFGVLPEHDVVIIDEAHDLVNRVTSAAAAELSAVAVETAARRCGRLLPVTRPAGCGRRGRRPPGPGGHPGRPDRRAGAAARQRTRLGPRRRAACAAQVRAAPGETTRGRTPRGGPGRPGRSRRNQGDGRPDPCRVRPRYRGPARRGVDGPPAGRETRGRPPCGSLRWRSARCWRSASSAAGRSC